MATDQLINKAQGDAIISGLTAIKNAINDQPVPTQVEDVVADAFDEGVPYVPGDYCIHENKLYICDVAHHGAWDGNDFTLTTVGAVLESLNNALGGKSLWTNSSPTSSFASQTVPLSLSEYKYVMIKNGWSTAGLNSIGYKWIRVDVGDNIQEVWYAVSTPTYRHIYVTTSGVQFDNGYASGAVNNTNYIPCEIVGYKA